MKMSLSSIAEMVKNPYNWVNFTCLIGFVVALLAPVDDVHAQSGNVYGLRSVQSASPVVRGYVLQTRQVEVEATGQTRVAAPGIGALVGGAAGAALAGKSTSSRVILGLVGTILGGVGGQKVADAIGGPSAIEYIVQLEPARQGAQGRLVAVTQPAPGPSVDVGAEVFLVNTHGTWRVLPVNQQPVVSRLMVGDDRQLAQEVLARSYRYRVAEPDQRTSLRRASF